MQHLPMAAARERGEHAIAIACMVTAWGLAIGQREKKGGVSGYGIVSGAPQLYAEDDRNVILAGVRMGAYTIERVGKRPVVRTPRDEETH